METKIWHYKMVMESTRGDSDEDDDESSTDGELAVSLLYLFIREYAWDKRNGQFFGCEGNELRAWLQAMKIDEINDESWDLSTELDIRRASTVDVTVQDLKNEGVEARRLFINNRRIICAQLVYKLRKVLPLLIIYAIHHDDNYTNASGQTVLHVFLEECARVVQALSTEQALRIEKLVRALSERGVSICALDQDGNTPLDIAMNCRSREIVLTILSHPEAHWVVDRNGNTALHHVLAAPAADQRLHQDYPQIFDDCASIVESLVGRGADVNARNAKGLTPVHLAAGIFHLQVLKIFADRVAADFTWRSDEGESPLHSACKSPLQLRDALTMREMIDLLVGRAGRDAIDAVDAGGSTPLHCVAEFGRVEVVERLLELGASVHCRTRETLMTPLHLAAKADRQDVMRRLVEAGADVNAAAADGLTAAFMRACDI